MEKIHTYGIVKNKDSLFNLDYMFNNTAGVITGVEAFRYFSKNDVNKENVKHVAKVILNHNTAVKVYGETVEELVENLKGIKEHERYIITYHNKKYDFYKYEV